MALDGFIEFECGCVIYKVDGEIVTKCTLHKQPEKDA